MWPCWRSQIFTNECVGYFCKQQNNAHAVDVPPWEPKETTFNYICESTLFSETQYHLTVLAKRCFSVTVNPTCTNPGELHRAAHWPHISLAGFSSCHTLTLYFFGEILHLGSHCAAKSSRGKGKWSVTLQQNFLLHLIGIQDMFWRIRPPSSVKKKLMNKMAQSWCRQHSPSQSPSASHLLL